jgi:hypothetical protein
MLRSLTVPKKDSFAVEPLNMALKDQNIKVTKIIGLFTINVYTGWLLISRWLPPSSE